jgi:hypothetical protein
VRPLGSTVMVNVILARVENGKADGLGAAHSNRSLSQIRIPHEPSWRLARTLPA